MNSMDKTLNSSTKNVCSYNEWDPLEEIIVGRIEKSIFPQKAFYMLGGVPERLYRSLTFFGGKKRFPARFFIEPAKREIEELVHILKSEGVIVQRPDIIDHSKTFTSVNWKSKGHTSACPRDCFLVIGNEIIEAPMSWRNRYFEREAYYSLLKQYHENGARWVSAPRPMLKDSLYNKNYKVPKNRVEFDYIINESEIVFDAADFIRCGKDIFCTKSNVTNTSGIEWLQRHLGDEYKIHLIETQSMQPMHIDTTLVPLGPGKILINPKYIDVSKLPPILKKWDVFKAPDPVVVKGGFINENATMCSTWLNMNVLLLDEERVIVEKTQEPMIKMFKNMGLKPIPCTMSNLGPFGGAFHCVTLDIRRRGDLKSYF